MAQRQLIIDHIPSWDVLPDSQRVLLALRGGLVDVGLADVVKQRGDDDVLLLHLFAQVLVELAHSFPHLQRSPAHVERMLTQSSWHIEVVARRSRRVEEAILLQVLNHIIHSVTVH